MSYRLTECQRKMVKFLKEAEKRGIAIGETIRIRMRDCNDVPEYIKRMYRAHEETKNSRLRFQGIYDLTASLN